MLQVKLMQDSIPFDMKNTDLKHECYYLIDKDGTIHKPVLKDGLSPLKYLKLIEKNYPNTYEVVKEFEIVQEKASEPICEPIPEDAEQEIIEERIEREQVASIEEVEDIYDPNKVDATTGEIFEDKETVNAPTAEEEHINNPNHITMENLNQKTKEFKQRSVNIAAKTGELGIKGITGPAILATEIVIETTSLLNFGLRLIQAKTVQKLNTHPEKDLSQLLDDADVLMNIKPLRKGLINMERKLSKIQ